MCEKTKQKEHRPGCDENKAEKSVADNMRTDEKGNWSEDQTEKSYYYDDSYGYEIYNPEEDEDDEVENC